MNITIKTKNMELTPAIGSHVEKKFSLLKKYIPMALGGPSKPVVALQVEVGKETKHHSKGDVFFTNAVLRLPKNKIVASAKGSDLLKIVLEAKEEMERELRKLKTRAVDMPRRKAKKSSSR